jgi:hypothetical protein
MLNPFGFPDSKGTDPPLSVNDGSQLIRPVGSLGRGRNQQLILVDIRKTQVLRQKRFEIGLDLVLAFFVPAR